MISIEPAWPAYKECTDFVGARIRSLRTSLENAWTPSVKELECMINDNTKMIIINYPNNPTGKILDDKILEKIHQIAKENSIYLLSDAKSTLVIRSLDSRAFWKTNIVETLCISAFRSALQ